MLRIAVLGCGSFASSVIWPCLRYAPVDIVFAYSRTLAKAQRNARMFGARRATDSVDAVLDSDVEAVFVIGPPSVHYDLGLRALEAGKHVFLEKPPAETAAGARQLQEAARRRGLQCQVGFQKRFAHGYRLAVDAAGRPEFGGIRLCKINYAHWRRPDWHQHLFEMSIHALDLLRFFLGDPAEAMFAKQTDDEGRSTCVATFLHSAGAMSVVNLSANEPHVQEWVELSGANQLISVRNLVDYRRWTLADDPESSMRLDDRAIAAWRPEFAIQSRLSDSMWLQGYAGEVVSFAQAVLEGHDVTPSIADGVATLELVEALLAAPDGLSRWERPRAGGEGGGGR